MIIQVLQTGWNLKGRGLDYKEYEVLCERETKEGEKGHRLLEMVAKLGQWCSTGFASGPRLYIGSFTVVTQHYNKIAYITNTEMYTYIHEQGQTIC